MFFAFLPFMFVAGFSFRDFYRTNIPTAIMLSLSKLKDLSRAELQELASSNKVSRSGNKLDIIARLLKIVKPTPEELSTFIVPELKEIAAELGLSVSGNKSELVGRIFEKCNKVEAPVGLGIPNAQLLLTTASACPSMLFIDPTSLGNGLKEEKAPKKTKKRKLEEPEPDQKPKKTKTSIDKESFLKGAKALNVKIENKEYPALVTEIGKESFGWEAKGTQEISVGIGQKLNVKVTVKITVTD